MKKVLYTILAAAAGLLLYSCKQEHIEVVYDPIATTVQTLGGFTDTVLDAEGAAVIGNFNPADFKIQAAKVYTLYVSPSADMYDESTMTSKISVDKETNVGTISIAQKDLNSKILGLGGEADVPFTLYFQLGASIANDKGNAISSTEVFSNIVSANFTPYNSLVLDVDTYNHVWIIGASSAVGSWSFDKVHQYLYDYDKTGETFTGLIDFGEDGPAGGFKLTGVGNWDDETKNWGSEAQAEADEAATVQIVAGGGSKDIKCYSKRYYAFSFNTTSLVLTKLYSFDNIGIVGAFNGWNAVDANMKMSYNQDFHRFYIDYTFAEASELKFTCDDAWDTNWGGADGATAAGGANIAVDAGSYRIYLDLNKGTYELSTSMFGKDEPTASGGDEPTPEPAYQGWSIIGDFNAWGGDVDMTETDGVWSAYFTNTAKEDGSNGGFKLRKDHDWTENVGGVFAAYGEPFDAIANGDNISLPAGFYKVVYDTAAQKITVTNDEVYSLIGQINGDSWSTDFVMEGADGVYTSEVVYISGQFKIRHNLSWADADTYGVAEGFKPEAGVAFTAVQPGANIELAEGNYSVRFTPATKEVVITSVNYELPDIDLSKYEQIPAMAGADTWGIIGPAVIDWNTDYDLQKISTDPEIWAAMNVPFSAASFKFRGNDTWGDYDLGGGTFAVETPITLVKGGGDMTAERGSYTVFLYPTYGVTYIAKGSGEAPPEPTAPENMYMIGNQFGGWDWNSDGIVELVPIWGTEGEFWCTRWFNKADGFKFCAKREWNGDFTGAGTVGYTVDGGNCWVPEDGFYTVYVNGNDNTVEISPAEVYGIGAAFANPAGWDFDAAPKFVADGQKLVLPAIADEEMRLAVKVKPTVPTAGCTPANGWYDWWKTEFIFFEDGKIQYRGKGNDQARTKAQAGKNIVLDFNAGTASIGSGSGSGATAIKTADELVAWLADPSTDASLEADIDLTGKTFTSGVQSGTFDGKNHKVTYALNVTDAIPVDIADDDRLLSPAANIGLFKFVNGTVKNLRTEGTITLTVSPNPDTEKNDTYHIGGVAGIAGSSAVFDNCTNGVNILANCPVTQHMGGIVGFIAKDGKITGCKNTGSVKMVVADYGNSRASQLGGIVGHIEEAATLEYCANDGELFYTGLGTARIAGIVGYINKLSSMTILKCTNNGSVTSDYHWASGYTYIAGISGYFGTTSAEGTITYDGCINNGDIKTICPADGCARMGGIASYAGYGSNKANANVIIFKDCEHNGTLSVGGETTKKNPAGGILGMGEASAQTLIQGCTVNGTVSTNSDYAGGFIGQKAGTKSAITDCIVTDKAVIEIKTTAAKAVGLFAGANAKFVTENTGKVQGGKIIVAGETTNVTADNYAGLIMGSALGTGGSVAGVTFGN